MKADNWLLEETKVALVWANIMHDTLGDRGLNTVKKNQFGDTALVADVACEREIIQTFKRSRLPIRIISEEHGTVETVKDPQYLAVLDGIDGTALYRKEHGTGKYGTLLGIFKGVNPTYADYICGGIAQHATRKIFLYQKDKGSFFTLPDREKRVPIHTSSQKCFDKSVRVYVDEWFEVNKQTFSTPLAGFDVSCRDCSCLYYADVAEGSAHFALECTRKKNLELAAAYGLITESGGVMVDVHGNDIGSQRYLEFGQGENEHIPIITAANQDLADGLISFLNQKW